MAINAPNCSRLAAEGCCNLLPKLGPEKLSKQFSLSNRNYRFLCCVSFAFCRDRILLEWERLFPDTIVVRCVCRSFVPFFFWMNGGCWMLEPFVVDDDGDLARLNATSVCLLWANGDGENTIWICFCLHGKMLQWNCPEDLLDLKGRLAKSQYTS